MILITGFEPFGIMGNLLNINPSKIVGTRLSKEFKTDLLIMKVNNSCLRDLKNKLKKRYNFVFMLGQGDEFRIETKTNSQTSNFAKKIKSKMSLLTLDNIGDFYCEKSYNQALKINKKTIFIHLSSINYNYSKVKNIFMECLNGRT